VQSSDRSADPVRERAAHLDGAAAFVISRVPPIPDNAGSTQPPATVQLMSLARSVQWITLAARPEGDNLRISLEGDCDTSAGANQIKSMLEVLRMFAKAGLENPKSSQSMNSATLAWLQTLLTNAEVSQSAERVRVLVEITPEVWLLSGHAKQQD
jgi:hypothetical protein